MNEKLENAAWGGATRKERRGMTPPEPEKKVRITGYLPDFEKFGKWFGLFILGVIMLLIGYFVAVPEFHNLEIANTCQADCTLSRLFVFGVMVVGIVGGFALVIGSIITMFDALGMCSENTIVVKMQEIRGA